MIFRPPPSHLRPAIIRDSVTVLMQFSRAAAVLLFLLLPLSAEEPAATTKIRLPGEGVPQAVPLRPFNETKPAVVAVPVTPAPTAVPVLPPVQPKTVVPPVQPKTVVPAPPPDLQIKPSWETQELARTYVFTIPAPRGMIADRNGVPLAQTRIAYNLAINFPPPPALSDTEANRFIFEQITLARGILRRDIQMDAEKALKHYKNRALMPLVITLDLTAAEIEALKRAHTPGLTLQPVYQRIYPQGTLAAHIVGYVGRQGAYGTGPIENNETLWPGAEGRAGLEKTFDQQLTGKPGVMHMSYDARGWKSSEKISQPPIPGQNVITTIDTEIQRSVERSLAETKRPGAMVITDPNTGEILALASAPTFDPNQFIPFITEEQFAKLNDDPQHPLIPRAYDSAYPPGSTFKVITGLAAMNEGFVEPNDEFGGEASIEIGGVTFRNWKKTPVGPLNFVEALTQSCNTYFYKMGLKTGHRPIMEYSSRLGLGKVTGVPLTGEEPGNLMTMEYMLKYHKRRIMPGDIANMAIGQGALLVTPLQMAEAMGSIGNGGTIFQPRLVLQVQGVDQKISFGYELRVRDQISIDREVMKALRNGMIGVVHSPSGTAGRAAIPGFKIAAKTGTAQWGSGKNERVAAWFCGFAPAERPKYAFAAVYEGKEANNDVHGGTHAAPMVARVLKEILKPEPKEGKDGKGGLRKRKPVDDPEESSEDDAPPRARVVRPAGEDAEAE